MASVFKRTRDRGNRLASWYFAYVDADGVRRTEKGCPDKAATEAMARKAESEAELRRRGIIDAKADGWLAHDARPLADHVRDWHAYLLAKESTGQHADLSRNRVARVIELARVDRILALAPSKIQAALKAIRDTGISLRSIHHYTSALKAFSRWLWRDGRAREHTLAHLTSPNSETDRRRVRRALDAAELRRILDAAERGPVVLTLTGPDRAMLYRLAMATGFRANELRTLTPEAFDLDGDPPTVTAKAAYSKRRRDDVQPIQPEMAAALRPWLAARPSGKPLFGRLTKTTPPSCSGTTWKPPASPTRRIRGPRTSTPSVTPTSRPWR
jgi:integrase